MSARYDELRERLGEIADVGRAAALLGWDERTHMPRGGAAPRAEHMATLTRVSHERAIADELGELLTELEPWGAEQPYDSDEASTIRVALRHWRKARRVPTELQAEIAAAESIAEHAWVDARAASDFGALLPHLQRLFDLKRRLIDCFDDFEHPYDALLDDFEPQMTVAQVRPILERLRDGLLPLIDRIGSAGAEEGDCLRGEFPIAEQRHLALAVASRMPLREGGWRLDDTAHPFATAIAPATSG